MKTTYAALTGIVLALSNTYAEAKTPEEILNDGAQRKGRTVVGYSPDAVQKAADAWKEELRKLQKENTTCDARLLSCQTQLEAAPKPKAKLLPDCRYAFANEASSNPDYEGLVGVRANSITDSRLETVIREAPRLTIRNENGSVECVGLGITKTIEVPGPERKVEVPVLQLIPPIVVGERQTAYIEDLCMVDGSVRTYTQSVAFNDSSQRVSSNDKGVNNTMLPLKYAVDQVSSLGTFNIDEKGNIAWTPPEKCKDIGPGTVIVNWYTVSDENGGISTTSQPVPITLTLANRPATEKQVNDLGEKLDLIVDNTTSAVGYSLTPFVGIADGNGVTGASGSVHYDTKRFEVGFGIGVLRLFGDGQKSTTTHNPTSRYETLANSCPAEFAAIGITDCQRTLEESTLQERSATSPWSVNAVASFTPYLHAGENFTLTATGLFYDNVTFEGESQGNQTLRTPQVRDLNTSAWQNDPNQNPLTTGGPAATPSTNPQHHFGLGATVNALWHGAYRVDGFEGGPFAGVNYAIKDQDLNATAGAGVGYAFGESGIQLVPNLQFGLTTGQDPSLMFGLTLRNSPQIHYNKPSDDVTGGK
ncbi:hypothetical protein HYV86_06590 [Candidatus Woesearchaeota archaeon]|nr:hypothetical protein [Candidatus Woesearchaeota archaeon]